MTKLAENDIYPYQVDVVLTGNHQEAYAWCAERFNGQWVCEPTAGPDWIIHLIYSTTKDTRYHTYKFKNEKDALLFTMRWR